MRLVKNAKSSWKWFSVQALGLCGIIPVVYAQYPEIGALVPASWVPYVSLGLAVMGIIGRLVDQSGGDDDEPAQ